MYIAQIAGINQASISVKEELFLQYNHTPRNNSEAILMELLWRVYYRYFQGAIS